MDYEVGVAGTIVTDGPDTALESLVQRGLSQRLPEEEALGFAGSGVSLSNHPFSSPWEESQAIWEGASLQSSPGVSQAWADRGGSREGSQNHEKAEGLQSSLAIYGPHFPTCKLVPQGWVAKGEKQSWKSQHCFPSSC